MKCELISRCTAHRTPRCTTGWPECEVLKAHKQYQTSEAVVPMNDLLKGKITRIAASLLKARLSDCEEDFPKRFPKHVLHDIERHNECLRILACELIDLKRAT